MNRSSSKACNDPLGRVHCFPGAWGWTAPWAPTATIQMCWCLSVFCLKRREGRMEGKLPCTPPGWVVPCGSLHRAQGTEGPGGHCVSLPAPPALWTCPPWVAVWSSASEVRTPEGWAVCGTPKLGGGHGLPTHVRHPSRFPSKHLPRKLSPAGPSPPPQSTPLRAVGLRSAEMPASL